MLGIAELHTFHPEKELIDLGTHTLAMYTWPKPQDIKAHVLIVHGLGEHMGRYKQLTYSLYQAGYAVHAYDQIGHGLSSGARGDIDCPNRLTMDLKKIVDLIHLIKPLVILGHSLGGLVVQRAVAQENEIADAVVLSSPAFAINNSWIEKILVNTISKWFAHFRINNRLDLNWLCRDAQTVRDYKKDKLIHTKISLGLAAWLIKEGELALKNADQWTKPTLLLYAGQDRLVDPQGSKSFSTLVPDAMIQTNCFNVMYHEIFNDPEKYLVIRKLIEWLDKRYA